MNLKRQSAKKNLDRQRQGADAPTLAVTAHDGLPQKRTGGGFLLKYSSSPHDDSSGDDDENLKSANISMLQQHAHCA